MPKIAIEDIRRTELVNAALVVLFDGGPDHATMVRIGMQAGMSHSIANYYFRSKDELLIEALRKYFDEALEACASSAEAVDTSRQKLSAIFRSCFRESRFTRTAANSWTSIYAQFSSKPGFHSVQHSFDSRLTAMIRAQLVELVAADQVELVADTLHALMDGIWLHRAKLDDDETVNTAIAKVEALIDWAITALPNRR